MKLLVCLCLSLLLFTQISFGAYESPVKQIKLGIPLNKIMCNDNKVLMQRPSGMPACVSANLAEKLVSHGWKKIMVDKDNKIKINDLTKPIETLKKNTDDLKVVPASGGTVIDFYINDDDLNLAHSGIETVSTQGLVEFTISGVVIEGPKSMIETGPNTGEFNLKLQLPDSINGSPIDQNDIVLMKYFDQSDATGEKQTLSKSVSLSKSYAQVKTTDERKRIGHEFVIRIFEPDANLDSRDVDRISLSKFEYRGEGGIRTTLANPDFDANSPFLETGENTGIFEVVIKIPRELDGEIVHIGDWFEITYSDISTPSNTEEDIVYRGKIG